MEAFVEKYSLALLDLANEENKFLEYRKEVKIILDIFEKNKELDHFFANQLISKGEQKDFLEGIFKGKIDAYILNFMKVIIDKGRGNSIKKILIQFDKDCNQQLNIKEGIVYSVTPLDEKQLKAIEKSVSEKLKEEIVLVNKIDPNLIAGIKVCIEDKIFDNSVLFKLGELKESLLGKVGDA